MHGGCDLAYYDSLASYIHQINCPTIIHQLESTTPCHNMLPLLQRRRTILAIRIEQPRGSSRSHGGKRKSCKRRNQSTIPPRTRRTSKSRRTNGQPRDQTKGLQRSKRALDDYNRKTLQILPSLVRANSPSHLLPPLPLPLLPQHRTHPQPPISLPLPYQTLNVPSSSSFANYIRPTPQSLPLGTSNSIPNLTSLPLSLQEPTLSS